MGYRVHYAKKYEVDWFGGYLNWDNENWDNFVGNELVESWQSEQSDDCEINKKELKKYINKINRHLETTNKYFSKYTNKEISEVLTEMLDNSDKNNDYIRIRWF